MIRIEKLVVKEFRGIRDLTVEYKGCNFAVCGPNGTGKSGIVDALEFVLTGNISRLSGEGTSVVSVKAHAPHVDSRKQPEKAKVEVVVSIPSLGKTATLERCVKNPLAPTITPNDPEVLAILGQVAKHPEFVLSRRELIRFVLATPGNRAKQVQSLLQLGRVEELRTQFQKIANSLEKDSERLQLEMQQAKNALLTALDIDNDASILSAINVRRHQLGLEPLAEIKAGVSLKAGEKEEDKVQAHRIPKVQALADMKKLKSVLEEGVSTAITELVSECLVELKRLSQNSAIARGVEKEQFLQSALSYIEGEACPVCDTHWDPDALRTIIGAKLTAFEVAKKERPRLRSNSPPS